MVCARACVYVVICFVQLMDASFPISPIITISHGISQDRKVDEVKRILSQQGPASLEEQIFSRSWSGKGRQIRSSA